MTRTWSIAEIEALGARTDLETGASIWGLGRTVGYELARAGKFPSPVVKVGNKWVVLVIPLLRALGVDDEAPEEQRRPHHVGAGAETILSLAKEKTDDKSLPPGLTG